MISISPHSPKTWIKCSNRNSWIFSSKPRCWSSIIFALQTFITSSSPCLTRILFTYIVHLYQMKMCLAYLCKVCHITLTYPQQSLEFPTHSPECQRKLSRWYEETHGPWSRVYPDKAEFVPGKLSALMHGRYSCNFTLRIQLFTQNLHTTQD